MSAPITEQMWSELIEDEAFDYLIRGVGRKELNENNDAPALDNICSEEVIQSCGRGPRGEQYASEGEGNDG